MLAAIINKIYSRLVAQQARLVTIASIVVGMFAQGVMAQVFEITPPTSLVDCNEEFETVANSLQPGDELVLRGGVYSQSCARRITVQGTEAAPILIRGANNETAMLTRPDDNIDTQNNIEILDSHYVTFRNLIFKGGSVGVRFMGGHHIVFEDSEVSHTGNNAISLNSGDHDAMIIRRNHIHDTGQSGGSTEGEGMYIGCNSSKCKTINSEFSNNYIHHLRATSSGGNDGIEVKVGSYNNIIRDNVIHDTNIGTQYPCIFVYGGAEQVNIVEGNVMWHCGEAIQVVSDAIIRNNIIFNSSITGITASSHSQVSVMKNVTIVHNTIYSDPANSTDDCLYIRWASASNMVLANNAVYCSGTNVVNGSGLNSASVRIKSNYVSGTLLNAAIDNKQFFDGGPVESAFVGASIMDFWPKSDSPLIGAADSNYMTKQDFNGRTRNTNIDVGAYQSNGISANPGWSIVENFKNLVRPSPPSALQVN